jgi:hypothetical protein
VRQIVEQHGGTVSVASTGAPAVRSRPPAAGGRRCR